MKNMESGSFAGAFWDQYDALVNKSSDAFGPDYPPALLQAAAVLVLANVLKDRQEGK